MKHLFSVVVVSVMLFLHGCGGGGGDSSSSEASIETVVISGAVHDAPVPFADVKLVLEPTGKVLKQVTADNLGHWICQIAKNDLPAGMFIVIIATNPQNKAIIRSIIDTDEVLQSQEAFSADETTVSHYTEAAIALVEWDNKEVDQKEYDKIKSLIRLENNEPVDTGYKTLDELAAEIQTKFDDNTSSEDELNLSVYKKLLQEKLLATFPDNTGKVVIELPTKYNQDILLDLNVSVTNPISIVDNVISFTLTPQEIQQDIEINIVAHLYDKSTTATMTLYAKGNSNSHYVFAAVAPSSEPLANKQSVLINGRYYTVIPYSYFSIDTSNANSEFISIATTLRDRNVSAVKVANNYANTKVLFKVYEGKETFDYTTLVGESNITTLDSNIEDIGEIVLSRIDDFRPIKPIDTNIEMPPVAPQF